MNVRTSNTREEITNYVLLKAWAQTFPSDLYDPITEEYKGQVIPSKVEAEKDEETRKNRARLIVKSQRYNRSPFTLATSFFGLPNSYSNANHSWGMLLLKNLTGWNDKDSPVYNLFFSPLFLVKNLTVSVYKTVLNIAKLFTEFLPQAAVNLLEAVAKDAQFSEFHAKRNNKPTTGYSLLYAAAMTGSVLFQAVGFVGRAITSPIQGVRRALQIGERVEEALGKSLGSKIAGIVVGSFLAGISLAITGIAMTFAVKFFAPAIVAKLHSIPWLNLVLTKATHTLGLDQAAAAITSAISLKLEALHIGILVGAPTLILSGTIADRAWNKVKNWWDSTKQEKQNLTHTIKIDDELSYNKVFNGLTINIRPGTINRAGSHSWITSTGQDNGPEKTKTQKKDGTVEVTRTWKNTDQKEIFKITSYKLFGNKKHKLLIENLETKQSLIMTKANKM